MDKYIMSLDQGTTSSRCVLFNHAGEIKSIAQKEFPQIYPKSGWVEHDPRKIWSSQFGVIGEALGKIGISAENIEAIGITNQRETTIVWDKRTGKPVYNAIVWQCRRTSGMIDELVQDGFGEYLREATGLIPDAYFSATKIKWILDHVEGARESAEAGYLLFGTVDTWIMWNLSQGEIFATDYTNASRTMLYNIHKLCWDPKILSRLQIPKSMLPEVKPSSYEFGMASEKVVGSKVKITGVAGDQQAALFGQCCFESGEVKNTYGTGCFLLMNTGERAVKSENGLLTTIAASLEGKVNYALEGSVFIAGAAVQWLRDEMKMISSASETEELARSVEDTNSIYIIPAFTGLGAPYWNQYARGAVFGLTRGVNRAHFVRAALEAIAYQSYDVIKAMERDSGIELKCLNVDGGASANNFLMQFQADILKNKVRRPKIIESTALGAAYLAGLHTGYWCGSDEIKCNKSLDEEFTANMAEEQRIFKLNGWHDAISRI